MLVFYKNMFHDQSLSEYMMVQFQIPIYIKA